MEEDDVIQKFEPIFLFSVSPDFDVEIAISSIVISALVLVLLFFLIFKIIGHFRGSSGYFEIDEASFGVGDQIFKLKPNETDRQIAYQIWVELSTRKIGLPIDLEDDVIVEIYDSWYSFFSITRELIKSVPVSKFRRKDTQRIINLSIDVLNHGIRPHLTKWQARFRRWYELKLEQADVSDLAPQELQEHYPSFGELSQDMLAVNERLMMYRAELKKLISS